MFLKRDPNLVTVQIMHILPLIILQKVCQLRKNVLAYSESSMSRLKIALHKSNQNDKNKIKNEAAISKK